MPTQLDTVIATVLAGGRWTAAEVAAETGVPVPTVRTYLARAAELGKLRREGRGVYLASNTERTWSTPAPAALWFEGVETGDGRIFAPEAIYWEGDSWPLQYADKMLGGHDGAELAGPIRTLAREGNRGAATGALYADTAAGAAVIGLLERKAPIGVSVDLDDVSFEVVDRRPAEDGPGDEVALAASAASMTVTPVGPGVYRVTATGLGDIVASCDCAATATTLAELLAAAGLVDPAITGITAAAGDRDDGSGEVIVSERAGDVLFRVTRGRHRGSTIVTLEAFAGAHIVLDEPSVAAAGGVATAETGEDPDQPDEPATEAKLPAGAVRDERTVAAAALAAANGHTGAMLALIPADPAALAVPGGEDPADLHVTLAYLGTASEMSEQAAQAARDTAAGVAYYHAPMDAQVAGIGTLGSETPPATVLLLNGAEMDRLRRSVWEGLGDYGWEAFHPQHEPWIPHTTLGYGVDPTSVTAPPAIRFDRVRLAMGDQVMDWPLTGPDTQPQDVDVYAAGAPAAATDGAELEDPAATLTQLEASAWHELSALPPLPAGWFALPTEDELPFDRGPVHYAAGRIWGWVARRGVPHESLGIEAPIDGCDLTTFLRATRTLDNGETVRVGAFTMNVGHHRDSSECETAQCAFDNTRTVAGVVTVGIVDGWAVVPTGDPDNTGAVFHSRSRDEADAYAAWAGGTEVRPGGGMWFAGAAAPWLSEWDATVFAACAPSGHWRQDRHGTWSLRAVLSVPFPGYPTALAASAMSAVIERARLALTPPPTAELTTTTSEVTTTEVTEVEAELGTLEWGAFAAAVVDEIERRQAARAELAALTAQIDQAPAAPAPATT